MKRKYLLVLLLVFTMVAAGCGKKTASEQPAKVNEEQNEDGKEADNVSEQSEQMNEDVQESTEDNSAEEETAEENVEPLHFDVLPEIAAGDITDNKIQIADMIFDLNYCMTQEDVKKVIEGSSMDLSYEMSYMADEHLTYDRCLNSKGEKIAEFYFEKVEALSDEDPYNETYFLNDVPGLYLMGAEPGAFSTEFDGEESTYLSGGIPVCYDETMEEIPTMEDIKEFWKQKGAIEKNDSIVKALDIPAMVRETRIGKEFEVSYYVPQFSMPNPGSSDGTRGFSMKKTVRYLFKDDKLSEIRYLDLEPECHVNTLLVSPDNN